MAISLQQHCINIATTLEQRCNNIWMLPQCCRNNAYISTRRVNPTQSMWVKYSNIWQLIMLHCNNVATMWQQHHCNNVATTFQCCNKIVDIILIWAMLVIQYHVAINSYSKTAVITDFRDNNITEINIANVSSLRCVCDQIHNPWFLFQRKSPIPILGSFRFILTRKWNDSRILESDSGASL